MVELSGVDAAADVFWDEQDVVSSLTDDDDGDSSLIDDADSSLFEDAVSSFGSSLIKGDVASVELSSPPTSLIAILKLRLLWSSRKNKIDEPKVWLS